MSLFVDIKKKYKGFTLDIQLDLEKGVCGLLGASGCGKSMTLRCISGIEKPDSGIIVVNGKTLFDSSKHINLPSRQRKVGLAFQHNALFQISYSIPTHIKLKTISIQMTEING